MRQAALDRWIKILGVASALAFASTVQAARPHTRDVPVADRAAASAAAEFQAHQVAMRRANAAVVGIETMAVEDARSSENLGRERQGSGVLINADGLVLTIGYLILEADHVDLVLADSKRVPARVVAYDLATGFGLVQALAPLGLLPAPLGVSAAVASDEPLMVASGGGDAELSLARMVSRRPYSGFWEYHIDSALFTAPAHEHHSGAGLFNADGELLGIGSLVVRDAGGRSAPALLGNMFVPVDLLKPILAELTSRGASQGSTRAWLGINCVEDEGRVRVLRLTADGPAGDAGLRPADTIVAVDGVAVADLASFYKTLWQGEGADRDVMIDVLRGAGQQPLRLQVHAIDRMRTLSRPAGI